MLSETAGAYLLRSQNQKVELRLNHTAAIVFQLCDGESSIGEIAETVSESFPDQQDQVDDDVEHIIGEFLSAGLIRI